jgi:bacterioferritin-associated ferredoxin
MSVDRCVCAGLTFDQLKQLAAQGALNFDALKRTTGCCEGCGLCAPYVRQMLRTGCVCFEAGLPPRPCSSPDGPKEESRRCARSTASSAKSS